MARPKKDESGKTVIGKNTVSGEQLRGYVERIERIRAEKKELSADEKAVFAEATAQGFNSGAIRHVVKVREEKPHDRLEREAMFDMYRHAIGIDTEPPLFRYASMAKVDLAAREQVIEAMKPFVPTHDAGSIDVRFGKTVVRLSRNKNGDVVETEVQEEAPKAPPAPKADTPLRKEPVPEVDEAGAYDLGVKYAKDNRPVIDNPFPYGDKRRAKFDEGWRKGAGGDGMGPQDDGKDD